MSNKCFECNKLIDKRYTLCKSCSIKKRYKNPKNHPSYIDGRCLKKYYCQDCGKKISSTSALYGLGRCNSCARKILYKKNLDFGRGINHGRFKDGRTLKKYYCIDCNKEINWQNQLTGRKRCKSCSKKGKLSHFYIDGKSREPYPQEFNESLKNKIRKRDNYICQVCNRQGRAVHHIDYNKFNCKDINLITLCNKCNLKANANRNYWYAYFKYIIEGKR
jgi:DNA-directed RNA polymerase subunit RPC12/RpoP